MEETQYRTYGYARVSSDTQSLERQIAALIEYGVDKERIKCDVGSGKNFDREEYQTLKTHYLREGDTLVIKELDRLGRNYTQIKEEWQYFVGRGINIEVIDMPILNTTNKGDLEKKLISNLVFEILSFVAEKERISIKRRQAEGISQAKARGVTFGRQPIPYPSNWESVYLKWMCREIEATKAMKLLGLKKSTFYRLVDKYNTEHGIRVQSIGPSKEQLIAMMTQKKNEIPNSN